MTFYVRSHVQKSFISHLCIFGLSAWVHCLIKGEISYLSMQDILPAHYTPRRTLVGYNKTFHGYCLYDPTSHHITKHCDVIFDEPFSYGPLGSLSSLLANDDSSGGSPHVSMNHDSSSLAGLLVDDS